MEKKLPCTAAAMSIIFLILLIIVFEKIPIYHKTILADTENHKVEKDTEIEYDNIEMNYEDNLQIKLPDGVQGKDVSVYINMVDKKVNIDFNIQEQVFDVSEVVNTATREIAQISYNSKQEKMNIDISLNNYYKVVWAVRDNVLYMRFLDIKPEDTVIVVDAGHGDFDVGANLGSIYEKNLTLEISNELRKKTKNEKFVVFYTRERDTYPTVEQRVDFANAVNADLFVSIHCNWYDSGGEINGTEVLYNEKDTAQTNSSMWLAKIMADEVSKACGTYNKGIVEGNSIHIVRTSKVPVALVEVAYMTNKHDLDMLVSKEGKEKAALGIYNGICEALKQLGKY